MKFFLFLLAGLAIGCVSEHYLDQRATCESPDGRQQHTIDNPFNWKHST
jgi:hypothetical protein